MTPTTALLPGPQLLPTGRTLHLETSQGQAVMVIRAPDSRIEVEILLTEAGPVVRLQAAALELVTTDEMAIRCQRLQVDAQERIELATSGSLQVHAEEMRVQTERSIHLNGETIRLNCTENADAVPATSQPLRSHTAITNCCGQPSAETPDSPGNIRCNSSSRNCKPSFGSIGGIMAFATSVGGFLTDDGTVCSSKAISAWIFAFVSNVS